MASLSFSVRVQTTANPCAICLSYSLQQKHRNQETHNLFNAQFCWHCVISWAVLLLITAFILGSDRVNPTTIASRDSRFPAKRAAIRLVGTNLFTRSSDSTTSLSWSTLSNRASRKPSTATTLQASARTAATLSYRMAQTSTSVNFSSTTPIDPSAKRTKGSTNDDQFNSSSTNETRYSKRNAFFSFWESSSSGWFTRTTQAQGHKPRVNRDDVSTSASARSFFLRLCLRRPGSHVAYACACACACVVRVNQAFVINNDIIVNVTVIIIILIIAWPEIEITFNGVRLHFPALVVTW